MRDSESREYVRTLVFAALLGVPVAFAAVLFQTLIHDVIHLVWDVIPDEFGWSQPSWWYVVLVPGLAGLLVAAAVRLPGHGGHSPLEGLGADPIPPISLASILPAALASLGLGLVLGPEAPLIALGLGLGAVAVRLIRMEGTGAQLLALAGAFAAIAALFGGPLIAAFLLFEVTAAGGKIPAQQIGRALLPGFVAAGTGAIVFTGVAGWNGLHQANLAIPSLPPYETLRVADLAWCLLIAVVVAVLVVAIRHLAHGIAAQQVLGPAAHCSSSRGWPSACWRSISRDHGPAGRPRPLLGSVRAAGCRRGGISGGADRPRCRQGSRLRAVARRRVPRWTVFPAIALGVAAAMVAANVLPGLDTTPAVAAGIAAGTTAVLRVPFTAVLLVSLLMGASAFDVAPIAVLAAAIAWLVATMLPNPEDRAQPKAVEAVPAPAA